MLAVNGAAVLTPAAKIPHLNLISTCGLSLAALSSSPNYRVLPIVALEPLVLVPTGSQWQRSRNSGRLP